MAHTTATASSISPPPAQGALLPLLLVNFVGTLGFSLVLPFLVYLVIDMGGNEVIYGLIAAAYPALQLIGAPILGRLSDSIGRRWVLFASQGGTLLSWVVLFVALLLPVSELFAIESSLLGSFALTLPLVLVLLARAFDGLTGGNVSVANAYLADISSEKNRKRNFGFMAASAQLGFILGPVLAGLLASDALGMGYQPPILAAMFISVVALAVIGLRLPESKETTHKLPSIRALFNKTHGADIKDCDDAKRNPKGLKLRDVLAMPSMKLLLGIYFLVFLSFSVYYAAFPIHAAKTLEWSPAELGFFFTALSLMMILVQGPLLSWLNNRVREEPLVLIGAALLIVNFVLYSFNDDVLTYVAAVFFAVGNGLSWPSLMSILARAAPKDVQGAVQGYAGSAGSLASIIGLLTGGFAYASLQGSTFIIAAVFMACVTLASLRLGECPNFADEESAAAAA